MMKREWKITLIVMGIIASILLIVAALLLLRGPQSPFAKKEPQIHIFVQAPPLAELGEEIKMTILVENDGDQIVAVDEIRLPAPLTDAAVIEQVFPSLFPGQQEFLLDKTGYKIGLMLEPGERREFTVRMMPWQIADVASQLEVISGEEVYPVDFRILFNKPVVVQITSTEIPPTAIPTWTPLPILPTAVPTFTPVPVPYHSVVKIVAKVKHSSYLRDLWGGSGTIVSPDGLILTNAHLVLPIPGASPDFFMISITEDPAESPVEMYIAEPVLTDEDLDLAVLRIVSDLRYNPVDPDSLDLAAVPLGDSNTLQLGDPLTILGYPGIGGDTITLTSGSVGGFTAQREYGERAFIKTSAMISGGTSGGVVLNANGQMVAVPTQLGPGTEENLVDCRVIADTNGDGEVDQDDACIPVGGFINALRPVNLALSMIESARQVISFSSTGTITSTVTITSTP
jgi:S1-C subfamily serine protease